MPITTCPRVHPACRLGCMFLCALVLVVAALRSLLDRPATLRGYPSQPAAPALQLRETDGDSWRRRPALRATLFCSKMSQPTSPDYNADQRSNFLGKSEKCSNDTIGLSTHTRSPLARAGHTRSFPTPSSSDRLEPAAEQQPAPRVPSFATRHKPCRDRYAERKREGERERASMCALCICLR